MTGGGDLDPENYGAPPTRERRACDPIRDGWDIALCRLAVERDLPTLAICRGSQILNVALGGTLVQHIEDHFDIDRYNEGRPRRVDRCGQHGRRMTGASRLGANTLHHQALMTPGDGVRVVAQAPDMTIEAIEVEGKPVVGVQWHPELMRHRPEHLALFQSLVRLASS